MGRVALPFCQITLRAKKPSNIPQNPTTIGEHMRKKRMGLNLFQKDVAKMIGVTDCTIYNWENNYSSPKIMFIPKILSFLGYNPEQSRGSSFGDRIIEYRFVSGLSQRKLAEMLSVDQSTLRRWENNTGKPNRESLTNLKAILNYCTNLNRLVSNKVPR